MNQSQKTLLQMLVLVAIAAGVGGYAYLGVFKRDKETARKQDHDLRLFAPQKLDEKQADGGSPPAEFTKLTVTAFGETTQLERRGNDWWLTSPVQAHADRLVVDGITSQLQTAKFKDTLDEDPNAEALKRYGLDAPRFTVEATAQTNGEVRSVKLVGGVENTFDGSIYLRRNDEKPVFTAEGGVRFMLAKKTFDLRDKTPLAIDEKKVRRLVVRSILNEYELERVGDKQWNLVKPEPGPADAASVTAMISTVSTERAQSFLDDTPANRKAFERPMIEVTVTTTDDQQIHLRINRDHVDGGDFYSALSEIDGVTTIATLGKGAIEYDRNPNDLKDKTVVRFRRELVTKIVTHDPVAGDIVIEKDSVDASADAWRVVAPRAGKAKVFKVTGALWTLGSFKALASGEEKPKDWARYGLDGKGRAVTLYGEDGKELARLQIGKEIIGKPGTFYVRGTREQVLESDGSRFGELPFSLADVLDEPLADGGADASVTSP
jgi:hypothetical protein